MRLNGSLPIFNIYMMRRRKQSPATCIRLIFPPDTPTAWASLLSQVQHHYAHVLSCMAENHLEPPVLGVSWDGTGYGPDGSIWGGEFLKVGNGSFDRVAHLRTFLLPGGDKAIKEPRRAAIGLLYEIFGEKLGSTWTL